MNCPEWEERILRGVDGEGDAAVAAHLRDCPACAVFAAELELDARRLSVAPLEVADIDYGALRAAARRDATWRRRRRKLLAALAVAAAILLASRLAPHRPVPEMVPHPAQLTVAPRAVQEVAHASPPAPPRPVVRPARGRRRQSDAEIDRQFAEYLRSVEEARHPARSSGEDSPVIARVATENPRVTILLLQESKGASHE